MSRNLVFYYNGEALEIVNKFKYLGIVFTSGGGEGGAGDGLLLKLKTHLLDRHKKQFLK